MRKLGPVTPVRGEMTKQDWNIINAALALLQASVDDLPWPRPSEKCIAAVREKVWRKIDHV